MPKIKMAVIGARGYPSDFKGSSGIDTYIEKIIPYLTINYDLTVLSRIWSKPLSAPKTKIKIDKIFCLKNKYLDTGLYSLLSTPLAILKGNKIIWYHAPGSCILMPLAKLFGIKTIITLHGVDWQRLKWKKTPVKLLLKYLEYLSIHTADYCTAVSSELVSYVDQKYHKHCYLIEPGWTKNIQTNPNLIIKKYGIDNNQYILYLGRLVPEKQPDLLIRTYNAMKHCNLKLIIAGSLENNKYCDYLIKLASHNKNIIFTDYVSGKLKQELLSNCFLYVLPSTLEGNSLSLIEALEYNKTCLISDIPIHKNIYQQNLDNIILFTHDSKRDLTQKLKAIITQKPAAKKDSSNQHISWKNTANKFKQTLALKID